MSLIAATLLAIAQSGQLSRMDGLWDAWLDSPGGRLRFELYLSQTTHRPRRRRTVPSGWRADVANASEHVPVPEVQLQEAHLHLAWPHYDSSIESTFDPATKMLDGTWSKRAGPDRWTTLPFHARHVGSLHVALSDFDTPFGGRWRAQFSSDPNPAIALFDGDFGRRLGHDAFPDIAATFLTTLGDYRFLAGHMDANKEGFSLGCFDGAHAFLFKATLQPDASLKGDFWSGDSWHETWTAVRDENAKLPDPFGLTKWNGSASLASVSFLDVDGKPQSLIKFTGAARMVVLFGSWCPNCNDEAEFLRELDAKYRERGLSIVGLAFELTGDFARDAKQVKLYAQRHQLTFPMLIAGTSDKEAAWNSFPLLDEIRAYPTTIFLHGDGRVRAVHQGYSGPATGAEHTKLREDFERLIDELLAESDQKK